MKIRYLGHSSFVLSSDAGTRFVTDPFGGIGIPFPRVRADAVTVSHSHYDHDNIRGAETSVVLDRAGNYEIGGIPVSAVECYHDDCKGAKRGKNLIFRFEMDGLRVCHLGDIGEECSPALVRAIAPADVLMIPVGGNYTIDAAQAVRYVEQIRPHYVIPMHYKAKGIKIDIAPPKDFLNSFDENDIIRCDEFEQNGKPLTDRTKIIFMERYGNAG